MWEPIRKQRLLQFTRREGTDALLGAYGHMSPKETLVLERKWLISKGVLKGTIKASKNYWTSKIEVINFIYECDTQDTIQEDLFAVKLSAKGIEKVHESVYALELEIYEKGYVQALLRFDISGAVSLAMDPLEEWKMLKIIGSGPFRAIISIHIFETETEVIGLISIPTYELNSTQAMLGSLFTPLAGQPINLRRDYVLRPKGRPFWYTLGFFFRSKEDPILGKSKSSIVPTLLGAVQTLHFFDQIDECTVNDIIDDLSYQPNLIEEIHFYTNGLPNFDQTFTSPRQIEASSECRVCNHVPVPEKELSNSYIENFTNFIDKHLRPYHLDFDRDEVEVSERHDLRILLLLAVIFRTRGALVRLTKDIHNIIDIFFSKPIILDDVDSAVVEIVLRFCAETMTYSILRTFVTSFTDNNYISIDMHTALHKVVTWTLGGQLDEEPYNEKMTIKSAILSFDGETIIKEMNEIVLDMIKAGETYDFKVILTSVDGSNILANGSGFFSSFYTSRGNLASPLLPFELTVEDRSRIDYIYSTFARDRSKQNFDSLTFLLSNLFPFRFHEVLRLLNPSRIIAFTDFPIELLRDGDSYLGLTIPCSRILPLDVKEMAYLYDVISSSILYPFFPLRLMIVAPQYDDFPYDDANDYIQSMLYSTKNVLRYLEARDMTVDVTIRCGSINRSQLQNYLSTEYDVILYIGHAWSEGLIASDGEKIHLAEFSRNFSSAGLAIFIGCETGVVTLGSRSVADIFLMSGMRNVIATYFQVSADIAEVFLDNILVRLLNPTPEQNQTIGIAVTASRVYTHILEVLPKDLFEKCPKVYRGGFHVRKGKVAVDDTIKMILSEVLDEISFEQWKRWESHHVPESLFFTLIGDTDERLFGGTLFKQ